MASQLFSWHKHPGKEDLHVQFLNPFLNCKAQRFRSCSNKPTRFSGQSCLCNWTILKYFAMSDFFFNSKFTNTIFVFESTVNFSHHSLSIMYLKSRSSHHARRRLDQNHLGSLIQLVFPALGHLPFYGRLGKDN